MLELLQAHTLLLDEIGEMPAGTQAKLLRVLEDRKLRRLGAREETPVNVRVIAATNKDPQRAVANGELRGDLYYRLNVFHIQMPALRDHAEDIPLIAAAMLAEMNTRHGTNVPGITPQLLARLQAYPWPGNARELRNTMQNATVTVRGPVIDRGDLPLSSAPASAGTADTLDALLSLPWNEAIARLEKVLLARALRAANGNRTEAARRLDMHRQLLYAKLKEHHLGDEPSHAA